MHWGDMGGWGWIGPLVWIAIVLLVLGGLVALVVALRRSGEPPRGSGSAEQILAERFARGEIDEDEYQRRRRTLRG